MPQATRCLMQSALHEGSTNKNRPMFELTNNTHEKLTISISLKENYRRTPARPARARQAVEMGAQLYCCGGGFNS